MFQTRIRDEPVAVGMRQLMRLHVRGSGREWKHFDRLSCPCVTCLDGGGLGGENHLAAL